jgi:hypothetical protein
MNSERHVPEADDARLTVMSDSRQPDDAAGREDINAENPNFATHHALKASRASTHLAAVLSRFARMFDSALDISQSFSEQLGVKIRHVPSG